MKNKVALRGLQIAAMILAAVYCIGCMAEVNAYADKRQTEESAVEVPMHVVLIEEHIEVQPAMAPVQEISNGFEAHDIPVEYQLTGGDFPEELQEFAYIECERQGVPYSLIVAMIEVESGYHSDAVSSCGAVGYLQVIPKWHKARMAAYGYDNLEDAEANLVVGIDYMAELLRQYDMEQALVVYNVGHPATASSAYSREVMQRKAELEVEFD
jgi:hypothetical protein